MESDPQEELFDDLYLAQLLPAPVSAERGPVRTVLFEARDIVMGGIDLLRNHPVGSIEVGASLAATGVALGAVIVPRLRHAH